MGALFYLKSSLPYILYLFGKICVFSFKLDDGPHLGSLGLIFWMMTP